MHAMSRAYVLRMLFEFHRQQNRKKPGTVHATYLVAGSRRRQGISTSTKGPAKDGDHEYMQSSPFRSSPAQPMQDVDEDNPVLCVTLVKEENLRGESHNYRTTKVAQGLHYIELQSQYEAISSVHVYSLGPHPLKV